MRAPQPIWPENLESAAVFFALEDEWRDGGGIDRPAMWATLKLMGVPRKRRRRVFEDLRVMEREAQRYFSERD